MSLLPGDTADIDAACEDAVSFYIDMGYVQEVQEKKARKAKAEPEPASDASAEAES